MRPLIFLIAAPASLLAAVPASAQAAGNWRVTGDVAGKAFTVDCAFDQAGSQLDGVCVDVATGEGKAKPGKRHELKSGRVGQGAVQWTYSTKFMMMSIDIVYEGRLTNRTMAGTVTVKGRKGNFTARRIGAEG